MANIRIPQEDVSNWLATLKPYQRSTLENFLKNATPEEVAEQWLGISNSPNIVPFGGTRDTKPFWDRFKEEFANFVCNDDAYVEQKKALSSEGPISKALLISAVSAAIGAKIGYAATLLAPSVTLLLCTVGQMGINAYCNRNK